MKKINFSLIAMVLFSNLFYSQTNVSFLDIKGKEIAIILDNEDNSFKEYYLFQYENIDFSEISNLKLNGRIFKEKNNLVIATSKGDYVFGLTGNERKTDNYYAGYGLSHRKGDFKIIDSNQPNYIFNVIVGKAYYGNGGISSGDVGALTCHSGGTGANSCSVTPSELSVGTTECSVTCNAGYYACCDDTKGECRCVEVKK